MCLCVDGVSVPEDLLIVEGVEMKKVEAVSAVHLIHAAQQGNSRAQAVLKTGQFLGST